MGLTEREEDLIRLFWRDGSLRRETIMTDNPTIDITTNKTLTRHRDIRRWVADRNGIPAISRIRNRFGEEHAQLKLRFARASQPGPARIDGELSPCSWTAWLAELDRQQLALRVGPEADGFELVERGRAN